LRPPLLLDLLGELLLELEVDVDGRLTPCDGELELELLTWPLLGELERGAPLGADAGAAPGRVAPWPGTGAGLWVIVWPLELVFGGASTR